MTWPVLDEFSSEGIKDNASHSKVLNQGDAEFKICSMNVEHQSFCGYISQTRNGSSMSGPKR